MHQHTTYNAFFAVLAASFVLATPVTKRYAVQPFVVNLSQNVPHMLQLINDTKLPDKPEYPGVGSSFGIDLDVLKCLQSEWLSEFDWQKEQDSINE